MSTFRIHRTDKLDNPISYIQEPTLDELSSKMTAIFDTFAKEQTDLQRNLDYALAPLCLNTRNQELLSFMSKRFSLEFSKDQLLIIFRITSHIKTLPIFSQGELNRFKIEGLCSFSLFSLTKEPSLNDTIIIHQKKKENTVVFGKGVSSKVCKALMFKDGAFSWVAEKTTYTPSVSDNTWVSLGLDPKLFLGTPEFQYVYYQEKTQEEGFEVKKKHCSIEPLYDLSLIELIQANQNQPFLTEAATWRTALTLINILQNLHSQDLIYRDLKPDNILIRLEHPLGLFDLNQFKMIAADLETVKKDPVSWESWVGSRPYFPKDTTKEKQSKPADIYALGIILGNLFSKNLSQQFYIFQVFSLIGRMQEENHLLRPTIEEIAMMMNALRPSYLHLEEGSIDCFGISNCVIS